MLVGKEGQTISRRLQKDGTFSFPGLEADTYEVQVNLYGYGEYVKEVTASGAKASGQEVKIEQAGEVQLVVRMGRGVGQVKGVVNAEGKPEAGAMVLLVPASGENLERDARMDQSDSDGTFTLGGIAPGKYVLMAIEDGWDLDWQDKEVLGPYREKGQVVEIGVDEVKKVVTEALARSKEVMR